MKVCSRVKEKGKEGRTKGKREGENERGGKGGKEGSGRGLDYNRLQGNSHKTFREHSSQSSAGPVRPVSVLVSRRAQLLAESRPEEQGPRPAQHWVPESGRWSSRSLTHPQARCRRPSLMAVSLHSTFTF